MRDDTSIIEEMDNYPTELSRKCLAVDCNVAIAGKFTFCFRHWRMLKHTIRYNLWRCSKYGKGSYNYDELVAMAKAYIQEKEQ